MTRTHAIIIDENDEKLILPRNWINPTNQQYMYPPPDSIVDVKHAIMMNDDPDVDYISKPYKKLVKLCKDYNTAVQDRNVNGIECLTDPSDSDNLKKTRNKRNRKSLPDDYVEPPKKRLPVEAVFCGSDSDESILMETSPLSQDPLMQQVPPNITVHSTTTRKSTADVYNNHEQEGIENDTDVNEMQQTRTESAPTLSQIFHMQKLILEKVNYIAKKVESRSKNERKGQSVSNVHSISKENIDLLNEYFPIDANEENSNKKVEKVEMQLVNKKFAKAVVQHLRGAGGVNAHDLIYNMVPKVIKDEVLRGYSFLGRKAKGEEKNKCFSTLSLCSCIYTATKLSFPNTTDDQIKKSLSGFLDQAGTRFKRSQLKPRRQSEPFIPLQLDGMDEDSDD